MKKSLGLVIVLFVILLCSYYGMGIGTEKALKKNIVMLNQSGEMSLALEHYQRGWFTSHADLKWTLKIPQTQSDQTMRRTVFTSTKTYTFEIPVDIYHGPIMWVNSKLLLGLGYARTNIRLPKEYEQNLADKYDFQAKRLEYRMSIFINYLNKSTIHIVIPQNSLRAKKGNNFVEWLGLGMNIVMSGDNQNMQGEFSLKGITWQDENIKGLLGPVKADYDMHQALKNLYAGTAQLNFSSLVLFKQNAVIFRMSDAQIKSESEVRNGLFNSSLSAKLSQLVIGNKTYTNNNLEVSFKNLDANILAAMNRKLGEIQHSNSSNDDKQRILWTLIPDLPALLSKGAQMTIEDCTINSPNGSIKVDVNLNLPKDTLTNPLQLLQKIEGESHIRVSQTVFSIWLENTLRKIMMAQKQQQVLNQEIQASDAGIATKKEQTTTVMSTTPQKVEDIQALTTTKAKFKIQEWLDAKVLVQEDTDYLILLKLTNGKLYINGHLFDPSLLTI